MMANRTIESHGFAGLIRLALADVLADHNGRTHRKAGDDKCYHLHEVASGSDSGNTRRIAEPADHEKVDRTVSRLQNQRAEHRQRKTDQGLENRSLYKRYFFLIFFCHCFSLLLFPASFPASV